MVVYSNTVVYPRTVVVKPLHALMADRAVPGSGSSDTHTVRAKVSWLICFQEFYEFNLGLFEVTRVST